MHGLQFGNLTKAAATRTSRRNAIVALLAGVLVHGRPVSATAQSKCRGEGHPCEGNQVCCEALVCMETGQGSARRCSTAENAAPVVTAAMITTLPYRVDVTCDYDTSVEQTSCVFIGSGGDGAPPIIAIILPADALCDEVVDGQFAAVDTPDGRGEAYRSNTVDQEGRPLCTLVFAGRVAPTSSTSYWCETENDTFPAEGSGLSCPQETLPEEISVTTGAILVYPLLCPAADTGGDYDWYASCQPDAESTEFELKVAGESAISEILTAGSSGEEPARFLQLDPGHYELPEINGDWCHAESDNTNGQGEVVVEAGKRTNVWVFHCPAEQTSGTS